MFKTSQQLIEERDKFYLDNFCLTGNFTDETGQIVKGITCTMPAEKAFELLHEYDVLIIEAIKREEHEKS